MEVNSFKTQCNAFHKQKLRRRRFGDSFSLKVYWLLILQMMSCTFSVSFRSIPCSSLYSIWRAGNIMSKSCACVYIFCPLLRGEALTNLGTRVKKSKIITTSNNCVAICSLPDLQSVVALNSQDSATRVV